ncbi:MAG: sugar-binding transcriptional regulator [Pseudomonadales bacterium]|jgi:DNA-binding transcriptional regulator LsrR (DeoR family)
MSKSNGALDARLEDAARAGWLYYVAQNTQDEIAKKMGLSRQSAQRLVSLAMTAGLVKIRLDHPVARCMTLAMDVKQKYGLDSCEVTLTDPSSNDPALGIAQVAAAEMERYFLRKEPTIMALGTGREIRTAVDELPSLDCSQHRIVSVVGSLAPDGSANDNDPLNHIGDVTHAPRHPLSVPVIASSAEERRVICAQKPIRRNFDLAQKADVAFVGIGELNDSPPLLTDGFITWEELKSIQSSGGVGEIVGWSFDAQGQLIDSDINERVSSVSLETLASIRTIGVARGQDKLPAIRGALAGKWLSDLITDEATAEQLLK